MFLISQIKKDFLWDISYKITFYGQFISIALTVFTFFFISKTFSASESLYLDEYDNNYFFFAIIGISLVDLITLCLRSASQSIRDAQSFGYIDYLHCQYTVCQHTGLNTGLILIKKKTPRAPRIPPGYVGPFLLGPYFRLFFVSNVGYLFGVFWLKNGSLLTPKINPRRIKSKEKKTLPHNTE